MVPVDRCYTEDPSKNSGNNLRTPLRPRPDLLLTQLQIFFAYLQSSLEPKGKQLRELLPPEKRPILYPSARRSLRPIVELLQQLENNRWKYCNECWSLYPHSKWRALQLIRGLRKKPYCSECHLLRGRFCYMRYTGEVEICPCLTITFRDKLHLMASCKYARELGHEECEYHYDCVLYHQSNGKLNKKLEHECTFADHPFAKLRVLTLVLVKEGPVSLYVRNIYQFEISHEPGPSRTLPSSMKAASMCPHKDAGNWLAMLFAEAGSNFRGWGRKDLLYPEFNMWYTSGWESTGDKRRTFEIRACRDLRDGQWPNKIWDDNCRN